MWRPWSKKGGSGGDDTRDDDDSSYSSSTSSSSSSSTASSHSLDLVAILDSFLDAFGQEILPKLTDLLMRASKVASGAAEGVDDIRVRPEDRHGVRGDDGSSSGGGGVREGNESFVTHACGTTIRASEKGDDKDSRDMLRSIDEEQSLESMALFREFQRLVEAPLANALAGSGTTEEQFVHCAQDWMAGDRGGGKGGGKEGGGGVGGGIEEGGLELLVTLLTTVNDYKLFLDVMMDRQKAHYFLSTLRTWHALMVQHRVQRKDDGGRRQNQRK